MMEVIFIDKMNISFVGTGAARPGWEEVHVLSENPLQDL